VEGESGRGSRAQEKAASDPEAAFFVTSTILLPLLDELRTYCYENRIEDIPTLLVG